MLRLLAVVLVLAAPAHAGPLGIEVGPTAVLLDTGDPLVAAAITATLEPDARAPIGIRLHASVGRDGAGMRVLGAARRQRTGQLVIDTGLGVASVIGAYADVAMSEALRPRGIGLALDVRVGYAVGPVVIAAFALPAWVFASDSQAPLSSAVEAGISIGL
jgi:hypothetical protein